MSGYDNGGSRGGFVQYDNCAGIVIDTQLSSPKSAVIADIEVGDHLIVTLQPAGNSTVIVVLHDGQVAGGLASPDVGRLREFIRQGTQYIAHN
jgi:hypothetical protein